MISFLFLFIGFFLTLTKSVSMSSTAELRNPRTKIVGIVMIVLSLVFGLLSFDVRYGIVGAVASIAVPLLIPLILAFALKQPKMQQQAPVQ